MRFFLGIAAIFFGMVGIGVPPSMAGSSGSEFLLLRVPAQAGAIVAGTARTGYSEQLAWNSAGLADAGYPYLGITHYQALADFSYEQVEGVLPKLGSGVLAARLFYAGAANFSEIDSSGVNLGSIGYFDALAQGAFAWSLWEGFSAGIGAKFFYSRLAEFSSYGAAGDIGLRYQTPLKPISLGFSAQNLGARTAFAEEADPLPMQVAAGLGLEFLLVPGHRLSLFSDYTLNLIEKNSGYVSTGLEYALGNLLCLRGGYWNEDTLSQYCFGGGLRFRGWGLDYAYEPFSGWTPAHRFTVSYLLQPEAPTSAEPNPSQAKELTAKATPEVNPKDIKDFVILPRRLEGSVEFKTPEMLYKAKDWIFEVKDAEGNLVRRYSSKEPPPKSFKWDGRDSSGKIVARDTKYQFVFKADGKEVVPRALPQLEPTTRLQFKGEAGIGSSVDFVFNAIPRVSAWSMEIVDKKNGKVVRQLSENAPLPKEFSWDGRTTEGTLADTNARYIYRLSVKYPDESEMTFSEDIAAVFAVPFKPKAGGQGLLVKGILFEFNSALLKPEMEDKIRAAAQLMRKFGDRAEVVCEGHSDEVGSKIFNQELSKRRAIMIRNHLAKLAGVEPNSIEVRGFGKTRPEAVGANESARAKNRRVEIRIVFPLES